MLPKFIDHERIASARQYYESLGFKYKEVPWVVSPEAMNITCPVSVPKYSEPRLVASGEQSFLELALHVGGLAWGKWCCATPCYRPFDVGVSPLHFSQFLKLELINYLDFRPNNPAETVQDLVGAALRFFKMYVPCEVVAYQDEPRHGCSTEHACDIMALVNGEKIELGSYGLRHSKEVGHWVYGTGVALPRFSQVLEKYSG